VSGKIITRVRERQQRAHAYRWLASIEEGMNRAARARGNGPQIIVSETPGAYASDPISRFFRWVFRL
jgi:hypothetical protein